jgi:hypothetical protein
MSLLADVVAILRREDIPHALIGAAAMTVHGVSRATADTDLLTLDARVLHEEIWSELERAGVTVRLVKGDADDPLAGNVRFTDAARIVDVVVGRAGWQREILDQAVPRSIGDVEVPVASAAAIVLLKLYAGGPKDAWDVRSLLEAAEDGPALRAEIERGLAHLDADGRRLWKRIADE